MLVIAVGHTRCLPRPFVQPAVGILRAIPWWLCPSQLGPTLSLYRLLTTSQPPVLCVPPSRFSCTSVIRLYDCITHNLSAPRLVVPRLATFRLRNIRYPPHTLSLPAHKRHGSRT